jgi:hypothetical protein
MAGNVNFDANNNVATGSKAVRNNGLGLIAGTVVGGALGYALGNTIENKVGRYASHTFTTLNIIAGGSMAGMMLRFKGEVGALVDMIAAGTDEKDLPASLKSSPVTNFAYGFGLGVGAGAGCAAVAAVIRHATKDGVVVEADNVTIIETNNVDEI